MISSKHCIGGTSAYKSTIQHPTASGVGDGVGADVGAVVGDGVGAPVDVGCGVVLVDCALVVDVGVGVGDGVGAVVGAVQNSSTPP